MAQKIIERVEARYETREVAFGKAYEWHPAYVILECDCGERLVLTVAGSVTACGRCGADIGGFVHHVPGSEDRLPERITHPWSYDAKERAKQHQQDEATNPEGSPWRYDDVTADNG